MRGYLVDYDIHGEQYLAKTEVTPQLTEFVSERIVGLIGTFLYTREQNEALAETCFERADAIAREWGLTEKQFGRLLDLAAQTGARLRQE